MGSRNYSFDDEQLGSGYTGSAVGTRRKGDDIWYSSKEDKKRKATNALEQVLTAVADIGKCMGSSFLRLGRYIYLLSVQGLGVSWVWRTGRLSV